MSENFKLNLLKVLGKLKITMEMSKFDLEENMKEADRWIAESEGLLEAAQRDSLKIANTFETIVRTPVSAIGLNTSNLEDQNFVVPETTNRNFQAVTKISLPPPQSNTNSNPRRNHPVSSSAAMRYPLRRNNGNLQKVAASQKKTAMVEPATKQSPRPANSGIVCTICYKDLKEVLKPVSTDCGHLFCMKCLQQAIRISGKCPLCNKKQGKYTFHRIYV